MTSQINPYNIDGTFPVAGQDNSSQGFRDNFTNTKNNLIFAKTELEDLQSKVLVKSGLTGTTLNNDLGGANISNATIQGFRNAKYDLGTVSGGQTIDFTNGSFQTLTTNGSVTISAIQNWPTTGSTATVLDLAITITSTSHTITFPSSVSMNDDAGVNKTASFYETGTYFFELISLDGGSSFYLVDKTRNYAVIQDDAVIYGNLTTYGARVFNGVQYSNTATSGSSLSVSNNVEYVILDTSSALTGLTVTLPSANVANTMINFSSTSNIANLKFQGNGGTSVKPNANVTLSAGTGVTFFYHATETTWYKIG